MRALALLVFCLGNVVLCGRLFGADDFQAVIAARAERLRNIEEYSRYRVTSFGLQIGPNLSNASAAATDGTPDPSGRARALLGANLNLALGGAFALQPELNYVQRAYGATRTDGELLVGLGYLELPVLLKFSAAPLGPVRPFAVAGPSLGYALHRSAELRSRQAGEATTVYKVAGMEDALSSLLFSLNAGVGLELPIEDAAALTVQARYSAGLSNITGNDVTDGKNFTTKLSSVQLLAGYQLTL